MIMEILGIILLAIVVEGTLTYIFGESSDNPSRPWIRYVSLIFGVVVAIAYRVDIPALAGLASPYPFVGAIVSGLIIGRGSNYVNDILTKIRGN
jgi:hypothetical protein